MNTQESFNVAKHMAIDMVYKTNRYCAQILLGFNKARRSKMLLFLPLWYLESQHPKYEVLKNICSC
jgi:hypothetical protein